MAAAPYQHSEITMIQETMSEDTTTDVDIRPFRVTIPEEALVDLRRHIAATRWPDAVFRSLR